MPPLVVFHGPSTTSRVRDGVLRITLRRFTGISLMVQS